jgi:hypothetical protein
MKLSVELPSHHDSPYSLPPSTPGILKLPSETFAKCGTFLLELQKLA